MCRLPLSTISLSYSVTHQTGDVEVEMIIWQEACPPDAAHVLRTASLRPCICDRGLPVLNCGAYLSVIKQLNYTLRRGDRLTVAPMVV